jgi:hypothetical protein
MPQGHMIGSSSIHMCNVHQRWILYEILFLKMNSIFYLYSPLLYVYYSYALSITSIAGIDTSPTKPSDYGKCLLVEDRFKKSSNWCKLSAVAFFPNGPNVKLSTRGLQTTY